MGRPLARAGGILTYLRYFAGGNAIENVQEHADSAAIELSGMF